MQRLQKLLLAYGHSHDEVRAILQHKSNINPDRLISGGIFAFYFHAKNATMMANGQWVVNRAANMHCNQINWESMFVELFTSVYGPVAVHTWLNQDKHPEAETDNLRGLIVDHLMPDYVIAQGEMIDLRNMYNYAGEYIGRMLAYKHFKGLIDNVFVGDTVLHAYEVRP